MGMNDHPGDGPPTILFLCTGNYYRSRFAEVIFNHCAPVRGLKHLAISRGLRVDHEQQHNIGPMSHDAIAALHVRGIEVGPHLTPAHSLDEAELTAASQVIALKRDEHEPMMREQYPQWAERITYWDVTDVSPSERYDPLLVVERQVFELINALQLAGLKRA